MNYDIDNYTSAWRLIDRIHSNIQIPNVERKIIKY